MTARTHRGEPLRWHRSLKARAIASVFILVTLLLGIEGYLSVRNHHQHMRDATRERASLLTQTQAIALSAPIWDFDREQVENALSALAQDPDFLFVELVDGYGSPLWRQGSEVIPESAIISARDIVHPTSEGLRRVGTLRLGLSSDRTEEAAAAASLQQLTVSILLLLTVLSTIYMVARRVTEPLGSLGRSIRRLARGDHETPVPNLARRDEIGSVARSIEIFRANAAEVSRLREITERAAEEERLRIRVAVESTSDGVLVMDEEGRPSFLNKAFCRFIGVDARDDVPDRPFERLAGRKAPELLEAARAGRTVSEEVEVTSDGETLTLLLRVNAIRNDEGEHVGAVAIASDVSSRREAEARIRHLALHDSLTGLANRASFREQLADALAHAGRDGASVALMMLDLDRFKSVNDTLGHPVGDALLRHVTKRLQGCLRPADVIGRLGGDEFAVMLSGKDARKRAVSVSERIVEALGRPFRVESHTVHTGTSVGIACAPDHGAEGDQLMRYADLALYEAKAQGRGLACWFAPDMDERTRARRRLEDDLRTALKRDALALHYQPQYDLADGELTGVEALARWDHPKRGAIGPNEFVPVAEESGLVVPLTEWLLDRTCAQAAEWVRQGTPRSISINLSPAIFRFGPVRLIRAAVEAHGVDPALVELEVTESVLISDTSANKATLDALRDDGMRIVLDDFGMGYSSLGYLQQFSIDCLKIDRSFIQRLGEGPEAIALTKAVVDLGHALDMTVVAEGIETEAQLATLRLIACDRGQGYFLGEPGLAADADWPERIDLGGAPADQEGQLASLDDLVRAMRALAKENDEEKAATS